MKAKNLIGGQELLCANVDKVYDWIISQANVDIPALGLTFPAGVPDLCVVGTIISSVTCDVTQVSVVEVGTRTNRTFVIDGAEVTLQRVNLLKTINITVTVSGTLPVVGTAFTITSLPITRTVSESFFLCAPEGTTVNVTLTDVECSASGVCVGAVFTVDISAILCQSIQVTAPVTIEVTADFCQPRENFIATCPAPVIPPQCPVVFPPAPTPTPIK